MIHLRIGRQEELYEKLYLTALIGFISVKIFTPVQAYGFDFSSWDHLLKKYVINGNIDSIQLNVVDYKGIKKDKDFISLHEKLAVFSPASIKNRKEQIAFWINVYNILAVKMVTDHYPLGSIKDAGSLFQSVWKKKAGHIGGKDYTLDFIEHKILRRYGEPRIHAAIVCASVSCPDLRTEAYRDDDLYSQLDDQMRSFLKNTKKGLLIDRKKGVVYLSSIFDWFKEDFKKKGNLIIFLSQYLRGKDRAYLMAKGYRLAYFSYNWRLNGRR